MQIDAPLCTSASVHQLLPFQIVVVCYCCQRLLWQVRLDTGQTTQWAKRSGPRGWRVREVVIYVLLGMFLCHWLRPVLFISLIHQLLHHFYRWNRKWSVCAASRPAHTCTHKRQQLQLRHVQFLFMGCVRAQTLLDENMVLMNSTWCNVEAGMFNINHCVFEWFGVFLSLLMLQQRLTQLKILCGRFV